MRQCHRRRLTSGALAGALMSKTAMSAGGPVVEPELDIALIYIRLEGKKPGEPNGLEEFLSLLPEQISRRLGLANGGPRSSVVYDGTEGELYRVDEDPHQFRNLWEDPGYRSVRSDLVADLYDSLPAEREPKLPVSRPA